MNIRKYALLVVFCMITVGFLNQCFSMVTIQKDPFSEILTSENRAARPLENLLALLHVEHDGTLPDIVKKTQSDQAGWLRKPGQERWQMDQTTLTLDEQAQVKNYFNQMHLFQATNPSADQYDYCLVLGAAVSRARTRIRELQNLIAENKVRINHIFFLGSDRPLDATIESPEILLDRNNTDLPFENWQLQGELPKTEMEMMKMVLAQSTIPDHVKKSIIFVNAPNKIINGKQARATTADTLNEFRKTLREMALPESGSVLGISNAPYTIYQLSVLMALLPQFKIEVVGPQADADELNIANGLDNLARILYQEKIRRKL